LAENTSEKNVPQKELSNFNKKALVLAGHTMLGLGIIGMILPLMPSTIFLLLASFCYTKSSPRFDEWIHTNKYFGKHLRNYKDKKGTTVSVKLFSITFLWISILLSIYTLRNYSYFLYITILLLIIAVAVTIHLITIKTYKTEKV
jgi:uncharacterized membrane protein YbaN (DUF454 family)